MIVIGLTGGIGSGKSTVSSYMNTLGIPVFDADASSRAAVKKGNPCLQKIVAFFGPECLLPDGELNRPWVADKVFHDKTILKQYEKIVQDQVWAEAQQFLAEEREKNTAAVVLDVPLLIECGWHTKMDSVWLVKVPKNVQIQRAMMRDGATEEAVTARINAQMSLADKEQKNLVKVYLPSCICVNELIEKPADLVQIFHLEIFQYLFLPKDDENPFHLDLENILCRLPFQSKQVHHCQCRRHRFLVLHHKKEPNYKVILVLHQTHKLHSRLQVFFQGKLETPFLAKTQTEVFL